MNLPRILPIRVCSPLKSNVASPAFLHEIYLEHMLKAFFKRFEASGYAVLSRKNGICLWKDKTENYGDWQEKDDEQILTMLQEQARNPELRNVMWVYWNHRPLTHDKWVAMMKKAGLNVIEKRKLGEIEALLAMSPLETAAEALKELSKSIA